MDDELSDDPGDVVVDWVRAAARAADEKQADDIVVFEVGPVLAITWWFLVCSAPNPRLVRTIAESVEEQVKLAGGPTPLRIEGLDHLSWVLIDYGDFVVHVFAEETRRFYDLERLWRDAFRLDWRTDDPVAASPQ